MDIKRPILIVALAIVAYLILLQWNNDYHKIPDETGVVQTEQNPATNNTIGSHQPAPDGQLAVSNTDPVDQNEQVNTEILPIQIETDVFKLKINPYGGDITQLDLVQYPKALNTPNIPFRLFSDSGDLFYKPENTVVSTTQNIVPLYRSEQQYYKLADGQNELKVNLTYVKEGVTYIKSYTFLRGMDEKCAAKSHDRVACVDPKAYRIGVSYQVVNNSSQSWQGYFLASLIRNNASDPSSTKATSMTTFLGMAYWTPDKPYTKVAMKDIDKGMSLSAADVAKKNGNKTVTHDEIVNNIPYVNVVGGWISWLQHYFVTAWIPDSKESHSIRTYKDNNENYVVRFSTPLVTVPAGDEVKENFTLYAGPKLQYSLKELSPGLDLTIDYGILSVIGKPIFWLLQIIHSIIGNWGWSIIVLTIVIKLLFFPLSATSYKSMARMRAASPKMQSIKERYGDDKQKMSQAMMKLYKEEKLNPLSGCLPVVIQMPVFISLYWVLLESVEIRQAPWLGWIHDLSVSDPFLILPIIMGATMFLQQRLNPAPPDPIQAKVFKLMPIIFTFFFIWFPAGLVLYWVVNNVLSIAQQWVITRQIEAANKK